MKPVTFDHVTPKSNQFIGSAKYYDPSFMGINQSIF